MDEIVLRLKVLDDDRRGGLEGAPGGRPQISRQGRRANDAKNHGAALGVTHCQRGERRREHRVAVRRPPCDARAVLPQHVIEELQWQLRQRWRGALNDGAVRRPDFVGGRGNVITA